MDDDIVLDYLVRLCNQYWHGQRTPQSWFKASVVTIFKKGDLHDMNKYRPISPLQISYKIFAALILKRLKDAKAEERIWKTQFGFRSEYGTTDALFMVRRLIDNALASKDEALIVLALD